MTRGRPPHRTRRALCEKLYAEGKSYQEIADAMGWDKGGKHPPATYIAVYRARGWDLPPREGERAVAIRKGRWGK